MTGNQCVVGSCTLPGGHDGPHLDSENHRFDWDPYNGRVNVDESSSSDSSSSSSTSSSSDDEEMVPDREMKRRKKNERIEFQQKTQKKDSGQEEVYALEIDIKPKDAQWLHNHPNRSHIWLSRKLQEKSKEKMWSRLTLEEKTGFDFAQAKELAQVIQSKALRSLTEQEGKNLDYKQVMKMRWVLTTKSDGTPKARLVVLGYQAPNLTTVQAASPTMNRLSRNMILCMCANLGLRLRAGDATSAFLQADQDMEDQNLTVWAPAELAVLFGAPPENPVLPLRIRRAFYGLVHAPRAWFDHLVGRITSIGWQQIQADRCIFILVDHEQPSKPVVSVIGVHVTPFFRGVSRNWWMPIDGANGKQMNSSSQDVVSDNFPT